MSQSFLRHIDGKNAVLKQRILGLCINDGDYSIAYLSKELNTSIPTITKLVGELIEEGFIEDLGKQVTSGGRKPSIYGLRAAAGYFIGTDVRRHHISIAVTDFKGKLIDFQEDIPFVLECNDESLGKLCDLLKQHTESLGIMQENVLGYGLNFTGRVNHTSGYSFAYFTEDGKPLSFALEDKLGSPIFIENGSRAMAYGEYICGAGKNENNMLFINISWGVGMGMILDGKLSYGKSGFSGEIGHIPLTDNNIMCKCGKVGCLETVASGSAVRRIFLEKLKEGRSSILRSRFERGEEITLDDIIDAVVREDMLAIEVVEGIARVLGKTIAGLINIFNPESVIIGGKLAAVKESILLPIISTVNKHSLTLVNKDTKIKFSTLGSRGGPIGACMISRSRLLGII